MASNWSNLGLRLMTTGENDNTWGGQTNDNWNRMEDSTDGYMSVALSSTSHTATFTTQPTSYADEEGRQRVINYTGSPGGTCTVTLPNIEKVYVIRNNTDQSLILTAGSGAATVTLASGFDAQVYVDGSDEVNNCFDQMTGSVPTTAQVVTALSGATLTGALTIDNDLTLQGAAANIVFDESDNALEFADDAKATFGAGADLQIYHDGSDSYVKDAGTGNLRLEGTDVRVANSGGTGDYIRCTNGGATDLLHNGSVKISTGSGGVDITGTATATAFDGYLQSGTALYVDNWYSTSDSRERFYFSNNSHTYIKSSGSTFFRTNNSNTEQMSLDTSGNLVVNNNITAYGSPSDENLKDNIEVIPNALDKVSQLKGVTFNYKKDGNKSTGLIAQDLEKVLPEVVYDFKDLETEETSKAVRYGNVVGLLVEAIKELKVELETHKKNCHCKEE